MDKTVTDEGGLAGAIHTSTPPNNALTYEFLVRAKGSGGCLTWRLPVGLINTYELVLNQ